MPHRVLILLLIGGIAVARGADADSSGLRVTREKLELMDRPYQGQGIALSPDGKNLAYTKFEDGKLWLVVSDIDTKVQKVTVLESASDDDDLQNGLAELRWATADHLILVAHSGEIVSFDINGKAPILLWGHDDNGLVDDSYLLREPFFIVPGKPQLGPPLADDPDHVLIEGEADLGAERLINPFLIDIRTGQAELLDRKLYRNWQVALYGRGDLLLWPPLPGDVERWIRNPNVPNGTVGSLWSLQYYFGAKEAGGPLASTTPSPYEIRSKLETFLSFPPEIGPDGTILLNGWPASPNPSSPAPPAPTSLIPETGAAVNAESSSTGRVIYDRQGRPRLLYAESTTSGERHWVTFEEGKPIFEPNITPEDLNAAAGDPKGHEFEMTPKNYFGERSYPLAFDYDPDILYFASNVGRDTFGIYALNLKTHERKDVITADSAFDFAPLEPDYPGTNLVFDDHARRLVGVRFTTIKPVTAWLDPELADFQSLANSAFPYHNVEVLGWSDDRQRFLLRVSSEEDPGAYFTYDRKKGTFDLALLRAPWLADTKLHASSAFAFETPKGVRLTGYLTLPDDPKVSPPPLLLYCEGGLWDGPQPGFNRDAQLLAEMGVAVMRVNFRGTAGHGRASVAALKQGIDTVPIDDLLASIDWISDRYKIDRNRVVVLGEGFGGYLALRALQLHPYEFRCAISLNAPINLKSWASWKPIVDVKPLYRNGASERGTTLDFHSLVRSELVRESAPTPAAATADSRDLSQALLVIESAHSSDTTPWSSLLAGLGLGPRGTDVERVSISGPFKGGSEDDRMKAYQSIEEFLNLNLYNFGAQIGDLKVRETLPSP